MFKKFHICNQFRFKPPILFKFRATINYKSDVTKTSDLKAGSQAEFKTYNSTYGQMPVPVLELVTYS